MKRRRNRRHKPHIASLVRATLLDGRPPLLATVARCRQRILGQSGLREKRGAHVAAVECLVGPVAAAPIGLVGMLDLDHVRPQHGQLVGRKRPRQNMRDVDHTYAFKGSRHRASVLPVTLEEVLSGFAFHAIKHLQAAE
jgi:hypothetical protein